MDWPKLFNIVLVLVIIYGVSVIMQQNGVLAFQEGMFTGIQKGMSQCQVS